MRLQTWVVVQLAANRPAAEGVEWAEYWKGLRQEARRLCRELEEDPNEDLNSGFRARLLAESVEAFGRLAGGVPIAGGYCWVAGPDGAVCGAPATAVDLARGMLVCDIHGGAGALTIDGDGEGAAR